MYKNVVRFASRDIILYILGDGTPQPMYRSTGRNSGMPGTWLPFDGIVYNGTWFDKTRYCTPVAPAEFQRFGNQQLKDISQELAGRSIPTGEEMSWQEVNRFLGKEEK